MKEVEIILDNNPNAVFVPGQLIQGSILLNLTEELQFRGIRAKFNGKAKVEWVDESGHDEKTYSASEDYFKEQLLLHGKLPHETSDKIALPPGEHFFPFRFQLPPDIPSSYKGKYGKVKYSIEAVVDKPWAFDITNTLVLTVIRQMDLNQLPDAMNEARTTDSKTLCCCCCESGPLSGTVLVRRKGWVLGETVPVFGEIENLTDRDMTECYIVFKSEVKFIAKSHTKKVKEELARIQGPSIPCGATHHFNGETFTIPRDIPPSFLQGCSIMDINYYIQLTAVPSGLAGSLELPLEIVVGTIPPQQLQEMGSGGGGGFISPFPAAPPVSSFAASAPPTVPPPSYDSVTAFPNAYGVSSGSSEQQYGISKADYGVSSEPFARQGASQAGYFDFSPAFDYGEKETK